MLKCRDVYSMGDMHIDGSLAWRMRLSVRLHALMCVQCRRYSLQPTALLKAFPHLHTPASAEELYAVMNRLRGEEKNKGRKRPVTNWLPQHQSSASPNN